LEIPTGSRNAKILSTSAAAINTVMTSTASTAPSTTALKYHRDLKKVKPQIASISTT
jgi:hypothetical protein